MQRLLLTALIFTLLALFSSAGAAQAQRAGEIRGIVRDTRTGEPLPGAGPAGHRTSFKGGMGQLIASAADALGPRLRLGQGVDRISRGEDGFTLEGASLPEPVRADAVVLACSGSGPAGTWAFASGLGLVRVELTGWTM